MSLDRTYIAGGHVYCRVTRSDMDVNECVGCRRLRELNERASPPYIVCSIDGPSPAVGSDPEFRAWWHQHHRRGR